MIKKISLTILVIAVLVGVFSFAMHMDYQDHNDGVMVKLAGY